MARKITNSTNSNFTYNFLFLILFVAVFYIIYLLSNNQTNNKHSYQTPNHNFLNLGVNNNNSDCNSKFNDICSPPLKKNEYVNEMANHKMQHNNGIPINIETRPTNSQYQQIGILTQNKSNGSDNLILPLMGRRTQSGRDKWQFYTTSNTGHLSSKLPISINGKSCTSEYGCDDIYNGDNVYVEGYNDIFNVTKYENDTLRYIPSI
tara:strand:- start:186 stop:803 length:618 start_codon:yes stop_codon:yes gene_type:complete